ncbi:hypothetical protein [Polyangium aurulentum]|uniref:hypothetical protein n=1 Tax=Polyangium aurulentum TaxID=2567896 RepID=UPI0010AEDDB8|nr:hypothetical protein [Polyangium aurulentum]UQA62253.1 hypothetical protein E8A73_017985 [Polyangium aurulentum]
MATSSRALRCSLCGKNHAKADKPAREACAVASIEAYRAKVATLKAQLVESTTFQKVMDYFFENFGTDPTFLGMGEPVRNDRVGLALSEVAGQLLGRPAAIITAQLVSLPEHRMTHGLLTLHNGIGVVFFFDDLEKGLLALSDVNDRDSTIYVRFLVHDLTGRNDDNLH